MAKTTCKWLLCLLCQMCTTPKTCPDQDDVPEDFPRFNKHDVPEDIPRFNKHDIIDLNASGDISDQDERTISVCCPNENPGPNITDEVFDLPHHVQKTTQELYIVCLTTLLNPSYFAATKTYIPFTARDAVKIDRYISGDTYKKFAMSSTYFWDIANSWSTARNKIIIKLTSSTFTGEMSERLRLAESIASYKALVLSMCLMNSDVEFLKLVTHELIAIMLALCPLVSNE